MKQRFTEPAETASATHSGLPIKPCYFPHDLEHGEPSSVTAPGQYAVHARRLTAQYQLTRWANQPVIGYGLPEHTRARMNALADKGMIGYFGQAFYNLVYDLVSHEGLDPDHQAARGRIGQCGMAVYSVRDMERLFEGLDLTQINVVHITYYQVIPTFAHYIAYAERKGVTPDKLRGNSMNWYHQSAYVGMSAFPAGERAQARGGARALLHAQHAALEHDELLRVCGVEEQAGPRCRRSELMHWRSASSWCRHACAPG